MDEVFQLGAGDDTLARRPRKRSRPRRRRASTRLDGDAGNDRLFGQSGADILRGGTGHDRLSGGIGADLLSGGPGGDVLSGGPGNDRSRRRLRRRRLRLRRPRGPRRRPRLPGQQRPPADPRRGGAGLLRPRVSQAGADLRVAFDGTTLILHDVALADFDASDVILLPPDNLMA